MPHSSTPRLLLTQRCTILPVALEGVRLQLAAICGYFELPTQARREYGPAGILWQHEGAISACFCGRQSSNVTFVVQVSPPCYSTGRSSLRLMRSRASRAPRPSTEALKLPRAAARCSTALRPLPLAAQPGMGLPLRQAPHTPGSPPWRCRSAPSCAPAYPFRRSGSRQHVRSVLRCRPWPLCPQSATCSPPLQRIACPWRPAHSPPGGS